MCGFAGFWQPLASHDAPSAERVAQSMADRLKHRGPDDAGLWFDHSVGLALAHRRLAILDLSAAGHQPMLSHSGRYVIVFNGEIYNHRELRREIAQQVACFWRGHSDTETLLAAIERWGIVAAVQKCVGMFAFALWDRHTQTLILARDRMGEKPLYYGFQQGVFLFASELKAIEQHPSFNGTIDRQVLARYLMWGNVPSPFSIYQDLFKLPQGTLLTLTQVQLAKRTLPAPQPYWSLQQVVLAARANPFQGNDQEALTALEGVLRQSIQGQLLADVPVGAFLSGGIDSSIVVALMQSVTSEPVRTFTIGFPEAPFNETDHARAVAAYLGCTHTELFLDHKQLLATVPLLPELFDEPFADASQIPTFLVAQLAKKHVSVSLSGDGGDELFAGYYHYRWPQTIREPLLRMLASLPKALQQPAAALSRLFSGKGHNLARLIQGDPQAIYRYWGLLHWPHPPLVDVPPPNPFDPHWPTWLPAAIPEKMAYFDQMTYLPDDLLVKTDRVAMAVSLETRMPFLDHRVIEWSWRLPLPMKIRDGQGKWLLRQLLYRYVPRELVDRPKTPFGVPLDRWLREPLRNWAETLLNESLLRQEGLDPVPIRTYWQAHLSGKHNFAQRLWNVLMFLSWYKSESDLSKNIPKDAV